MNIEEHYGQLLGIHSPWETREVDLKIDEQRVDSDIEYDDDVGSYPECGVLSSKHDDRKMRSRRHLNIMQFSTYIHCEVPRVRCKTHGVKTITAPWTGKNRRFTPLFEGFAIRVLQAARSIEEARKLLGLNWHQVNAIKGRAVERGQARREEVNIPYIGIDEKQFRSGQNYISSLMDLQEGRVLDMVEERTEKACKKQIEKSISEEQKQQVTAVALDTLKAYANAVDEQLPQADIIHDRFHISQHLNNAVNKVYHQENKNLFQQGDNHLVGIKFSWLTNEENLKEELTEQFNKLKNVDLKVSRTWAIKELLRHYWTYTYAGWAERHFYKWYSWAIRSRLELIKKEAQMIKNHLPNILTHFKHQISNAVAEGLNSKIQTIKVNARGYRSFDGFRISIQFYCGGLDMKLFDSHFLYEEPNNTTGELAFSFKPVNQNTR
jgi:transposase